MAVKSFPAWKEYMKHSKVKIKQLKMAKKVSSQSHQHSKCQIATIPDVRCFHSGNCVELIQRRWTVNSMLLLLLCVLSLNDFIPSRVRLFSFHYVCAIAAIRSRPGCTPMPSGAPLYSNYFILYAELVADRSRAMQF